jgi:hypothetical protein
MDVLCIPCPFQRHNNLLIQTLEALNQLNMRPQERNASVSYINTRRQGQHKATLIAKVDEQRIRVDWECTDHFEQRCKEGGLSIQDALLIIDLGLCIPKGHYNLYAISRQMAHELNLDTEFQRLQGWVVVESADGALVTCYKTHDAYGTIKKKRILYDHRRHPH